MRIAGAALTAVGIVFAPGAGVAGVQTHTAAPTRVMRLEAPASLPETAIEATCTPSVVASFRSDGRRCTTTAGATIDPCVPTRHEGQLWCLADPGRPAEGRLIRVIGERPRTDPPALGLAWFVELEDGSACRPIPGGGRDVDGAQEIYAYTFVSPGEADNVVLGELNQDTPVWTLQKAALNKKFTPVTIKSLSIVSVVRVWQ